MNITQYTSDWTSRVSPSTVSTLPARLWRSYLDYLVYYESDSWVARIAYAFRVLSILVALPIVVLGMLDITSYLIARTLGVVDDVKASTSDKATVHPTHDDSESTVPSIHVQATSPATGTDTSFSDSSRESFVDHNERNKLRLGLDMFYAGAGEEGNFRLSGADVFSPAASQPPSPTISRQQLPFDDTLRHRTLPTTRETEAE